MTCAQDMPQVEFEHTDADSSLQGGRCLQVSFSNPEHVCSSNHQVSHLSPSNLVVLLWLVLQGFDSPVFLLISQLQEPLYVLSVVATSIGGEEVSKETLHENLDRPFS